MIQKEQQEIEIIDPNDKKKILANITAEVQALQMLTGSYSVLSQILISYLKNLYSFISYLSHDLDNIFNKILESYSEKNDFSYRQATANEKENLQY